MAKIVEVVKLKSGYANFVELKSAFDASQENADRMAMYRPTKAHQAALILHNAQQELGCLCDEL